MPLEINAFVYNYVLRRFVAHHEFWNHRDEIVSFTLHFRQVNLQVNSIIGEIVPVCYLVLLWVLARSTRLQQLNSLCKVNSLDA